jgi:hypothetical protein
MYYETKLAKAVKLRTAVKTHSSRESETEELNKLWYCETLVKKVTHTKQLMLG